MREPIRQDFLSFNPYSRPNYKRIKTLAVVLHWVAGEGKTAQSVKDWFELRKSGKYGYGSTQYAIGTEGEIIQMMDDDEVAWQVGAEKPDPVSGKMYTDYARTKFPGFTNEPKNPNYCTIGMELCHIDWAGRFTDRTLESAAQLTAELLEKYGLTAGDVTTHNEIVGYKDCPRWFVNHPDDLDQFIDRVAQKMRSKSVSNR